MCSAILEISKTFINLNTLRTASFLTFYMQQMFSISTFFSVYNLSCGLSQVLLRPIVKDRIMDDSNLCLGFSRFFFSLGCSYCQQSLNSALLGNFG